MLLITSRDTGRWVIPRGRLENGLTSAQTAELEAYEEAGVKGVTSEIPLGIFTYNKRLRSGIANPATVEVYAMRVEKNLEEWPERSQRRLEWMPISEAVKLVQEPGLAILLHRLEEIEAAKSAKAYP